MTTLPVNYQLFPGADPSTFTWWPGRRWRGPITPEVAKALPGIARGVSLIAGQLSIMPLDDYKGVVPQTRPPLLEQPDPEESRTWFVSCHAEDYLLNGNAVSYVTTRYQPSNWPATVVWIPAAWVTITRTPGRGVDYWVGGMRLNRDDVIHVKRGADRMNPGRGLGVVEQHLDALGVVRDQHSYEGDVLQGAAVPSVAVIAPNPLLSQDEADEARSTFMEKYGGGTRTPGVFPAGTQIIPLAWSPSDSQLNEARTLSLTDQANMLNLDGYWLGAPGGSMTYKSPGPMYLNLLRQTLEPIASTFEDVWSVAWLPRGRRVRFDRAAVLRDDMATMVRTAKEAKEAGLWTEEEARIYLGLAPTPSIGVLTTSPVATTALPDTSDIDEETDSEEEQ